MKNITLNKVTSILIELDEEYAKKYPKFKQLEREYIKEYDKLVINSQGMFPNQPSREAYARQELEKLPIYEKFNNLLVKIKILEVRMKTLHQVSKNLVSSTWGEVEINKSDY